MINEQEHQCSKYNKDVWKIKFKKAHIEEEFCNAFKKGKIKFKKAYIEEEFCNALKKRNRITKFSQSIKKRKKYYNDFLLSFSPIVLIY